MDNKSEKIDMFEDTPNTLINLVGKKNKAKRIRNRKHYAKLSDRNVGQQNIAVQLSSNTFANTQKTQSTENQEKPMDSEPSKNIKNNKIPVKYNIDTKAASSTDKPTKPVLLRNNVVLIGPRKLVPTVQKKHNQMQMAGFKSRPIIQNPAPQPECIKLPKFQLNEASDNQQEAMPVFKLNEPAANPNQQPVFNVNQTVDFNTNQAAGFNPSHNGYFNASMPGGSNTNQIGAFNQSPTGFEPGQMTAQVVIPGMGNPSQFMRYPKGIPRSMIYAAHQEILMQQAQQELQPNWVLNDVKDMSPVRTPSFETPICVDTSNFGSVSQTYSPSEIYADTSMDIGTDDISEQNQDCEMGGEGEKGGGKRVSAFQRLGPQTRPKTPKLTVNVNLQTEQPVREVVEETEIDDEKYSPVHLRPNIINSTDETVIKYLGNWPWKKEVQVRKTVAARSSKSAMLLEQEKMQELYEKENTFFLVDVKGYPPSWNKEDVLDAVLESLRGRSMIPCFINFTKRRCSFFVLRSKPALVEIHRNGFTIIKDDTELRMCISLIFLNINHIDFIPRLILRKRLTMVYDGERKLSLREFTLKEDISNFIYFPLHVVVNQADIVGFQSTVSWKYLTDLDLSHNRLKTISGFNLPTVTPKLKHLDLSHNYIGRITELLHCRGLPLNSIVLEGNPLVLDYIGEDHYVKVIRMMFPCIHTIDGQKIFKPGTIPEFKKNYCPENAKRIVEKFLEVFFPLLDSDEDQRSNLVGMYHPKVVLTITYNNKLRCKPVYRCFRNMFMWARDVSEGNLDSVEGATAVLKLLCKWPHFRHDPTLFHVDVLHHAESTTMVRVNGVLKLTAKSLADDEYLLAFTRTFVLHTENGAEYKIHNDMVYWEEPSKDHVKNAFQYNTIKSNQLSLKFDSEPNKLLKEKLLKIFSKITSTDEQISKRCLEVKNWDLKEALEYFTKFLKLDSLEDL